MDQGRPNEHTPYRQNLIRVSAFEDTLLRILERIPPRSLRAREIVKDELAKLRSRELTKAKLVSKKKSL